MILHSKFYVECPPRNRILYRAVITPRKKLELVMKCSLSLLNFKLKPNVLFKSCYKFQNFTQRFPYKIGHITAFFANCITFKKDVN